MDKIKQKSISFLKILKSDEISEYCVSLSEIVIEFNDFANKNNKNIFKYCRKPRYNEIFICTNKLKPAIAKCLHQILLETEESKTRLYIQEIHKILRFNSNALVSHIANAEANKEDLRGVILNGFY